MPWKSLPLEKTQLLKFLTKCIESFRNEESDPFGSEEYFPKRSDSKSTSLLNVFLGLGVTVMKNANDNKVSIGEILKLEQALAFYLKTEKLSVGEDFYDAVASAFNIRLIIYDVKDNKPNNIAEYMPKEEQNTKLRTINVVMMEKLLLLVYSWSPKARVNLFLESSSDFLAEKCSHLKTLIQLLKAKKESLD
eukprot:TRINITY_DN12746_c0_g2_i1.p1 TRINITY_DN12746_c0_g2~~TRINITY_DN12746_c0_g2_i1.p1  ORF type:complete len:192 (+),score=36.19 TRINITY_DN12746_c0_g2_i1:587-1162(+)